MEPTAAFCFSLYRQILREHRHLPVVMRKLGNEYVKSEFKLHKTAKPAQLLQFINAWESYVKHLGSNRSASVGVDMDRTLKSTMSEEQRQKLLELKSQATLHPDAAGDKQ